jgi:hypothetical protein
LDHASAEQPPPHGLVWRSLFSSIPWQYKLGVKTILNPPYMQKRQLVQSISTPFLLVVLHLIFV